MPGFKNYFNIGSVLMCMWLLTQVSGEDYCSDYLVSGPNGVEDNRMTASSYLLRSDLTPQSCSPARGRLYLTIDKKQSVLLHDIGAWCALLNDSESYLQVEFDNVKIIRAVKTQGRGDYPQWVSSFTITYSMYSQDNDWQRILNSTQGEVVFPGNNDSNTVVSNQIPGGFIEAKRVRIHPKSYTYRQSLRFDVIGCKKTKPSYSYNLENGIHMNETWKVHPIQITGLESALWNKTVPHLGACAIYCQKSPCKSFSFDSKTKTCTAFNEEFLNRMMTETIHDTRYYIRTSTWRYYLNILREYEYEFDGNAVFRVYTHKTDASKAAAICMRYNTTLLMIKNLVMWRFLQNYIQRNLILSNKNYFRIDGKEQNGSWRVSDGTVIPAYLWASGEPKNMENGCVGFTKEGLKVRSCTTKSSLFICGFEMN